MSDNWYYIQQWAANRWSRVGLEMIFFDAEKLFETLTQTENNSLALLMNVEDNNMGKIIRRHSEATEGWKIVRFNSKFMVEGNYE
tara:strand:+ start:214 stop:468 length:255 start_codon:yes stop_codon:yes gene_type:complete